MEKYIISLLDLNSRVIVPELGAFIIRQKDPKELVFNDLLSFDDGMLTDHIMQEDKLSKSEAQNRIRLFADKVKQSLEAGEAYKLGKLGILKMDDTNRIEFSTSDSARDAEETLAEETPAETIENKTEKAIQEPEPEIEEPSEIPDPTEAEPEIEDPPETTDSTGPEPEIKEPSEIPDPTEPEPTSEEGGFVLADGDSHVDIDATREDTPLKPDREEPPFQIEDEEEQKTESAVTKTPEKTAITEVPEEKKEYHVITSEPEPSPFSAYTRSPKTNKKTWPWIAGAATLIIILLAAGWFIFPEKTDKLLGREVTESIDQELVLAEGDEGISEDTETNAEEPEIPGKDQAGEAQIGETEVVEAASPVQPAGRKYYVVAGCFAELKNAENYVQKLQDQGYNASIFGTYKNLHAVCFNSHPGKQDAVNELYRIRDSFDPHAWVLYY